MVNVHHSYTCWKFNRRTSTLSRPSDDDGEKKCYNDDDEHTSSFAPPERLAYE